MGDLLKFMELRRVLANEWAEAEPRMVEVGWLEERVHAAEEDLEVLRVARAGVNELTAERRC